MAEVIAISSHPKFQRVYSLKDARRFLGGGFFRKALFEWSIEELVRTINHPECFLSDAFEAYSAILRFRQRRAVPGQTAPVIPFRRAA